MKRRLLVLVCFFVPCGVFAAYHDSTMDELPGMAMSLDEAATIRAAVVIKGNCTVGVACTGVGVTCALVADGSKCVDDTSDCDTCTGANDNSCVALPTSAYSCDNLLPLALCCTITKECVWGRAANGDPTCDCTAVNGAAVQKVTRIVC